MAKSHDTSLSDILRDISDGTTQLPDFQRGWVWDDGHIRALIASITCSYPVGAVMFLECGGSGIRFKSRMFTGVPDSGRQPKTLVLDGQQRLTSIYCAMYGRDPVPTRTAKKRMSSGTIIWTSKNVSILMSTGWTASWPSRRTGR